MFGHNVSHAQNKTKRRFNPNVQDTSVLSDALGEWVRLRVTPAGLRTIEHNGGLDAFLLGTPDRKLTTDALSIKKRIRRRLEKQGDSAAA